MSSDPYKDQFSSTLGNYNKIVDMMKEDNSDNYADDSGESKNWNRIRDSEFMLISNNKNDSWNNQSCDIDISTIKL